jgi:NAD(P)-dependent dehydrogenase (short-subunit alcohol dehydrogenase family)
MIVITGASSGLGEQLAKLFQADGKTVVNIARRKSAHADINLLHNLREGDEINAAAKEVLALPEPLELVINCAGVYTKQALGEITEAEIKRTMATNVKAPVMLVSGLIERIKKDGSDIVNVSSVAGLRGAKDEAVYGASKWAVRGFSQNLQVELKDYPCRVISFCPGGFSTELFVKATGTDATKDGTVWMDTREVALCLKQLVDLPKNMEISEVILNRKKL